MRLLEGYVAPDLADLRGQLCGKLLRDLGMAVVKVEPPDGDPVRRLGPFAHDQPHPEGSLRFAYLNAGKQSVVLDLTSAADRDQLLRLVRRADVLVESFDPGTLAGLGLDEARLREHNPRLVVTSVTGFGQDGPYRDYRCPDLVGLAMGGVLGISGDPALPPVQAPETQAYYFASVYAAFGTVLALWRRAHDGQGRGVDVVVDTSGGGGAIASGVRMLRRRGRMCGVGVSGRDSIEFPWDEALFRAIDLHCSFSSSYTSWDGALSLLRSGAVQIEPLTTLFPLERWDEAFRALEAREVVKAVLTP